MNSKILISISLFLGLCMALHAQKSQLVNAETNEGIPYAHIISLDGETSILCDTAGYFSMNKSLLNETIIVSAFGFLKDTVKVKTLQGKYTLTSATDLDAVTVSSKKKTSSMLFANTIQTENIDSEEMYKAACCNLAESFETNPSIDATYSDGASGSKNIKLLGLGGKYALLSVENMPRIRGNALISGLNSISGSWVESIQVLKGNSSVVNGFEGLTGQINTELKGLGAVPVQEITLYGNSFGRLEAAGINQLQHSNKFKAALLWNVSGFTQPIDDNSDGFYELPSSFQKNFIVSQNYSPTGKFHNDLNIAFNESERNGGSVDDSFPLKLKDKNFGFFGKSGIVLDNTGKSIGFQYSYNQYNFNADIGNKTLSSKSNELYLNLIHQNYIGNTNHIIKGGLSLLREEANDSIIQVFANKTVNSAYQFARVIPGAFVEYSGTLSENDNLTVGIRSDYYQDKLKVSPRINYRHAFDSKTVFRTGFGKAFRSNYLNAEHYSMMINNREVIGIENLIEPEESWSVFSSIWRKFKIGYREGDILIEHHYQQFSNRVLAHYDDADVLNLRQHSKALSQSFLVQVNYEIIPSLELKLAYKYNEQKANDLNGGFNNIWLIPHNRSFINLGYETRDKWLFNVTLNRVGTQNLPLVPISDIAFQRDVKPFYLLNLHLSKTIKKWRVYGGAENLLDTKQENAWLGLSEGMPEASIAWQSPVGRTFLLGINYNLKGK